MRAAIFNTLILSAVLVTAPVRAESADDIERLRALNASGAYADAYALALESREALEGLPAFDLAYGIAAVDSGHPSEAIFAFERVLLAHPSHQAARLELARAYFLIGELDRAERLFSEVLAVNPPADVRRRVTGFLGRIERLRAGPLPHTRRELTLRAGYDDNVNAGPDDAASLVLYDVFGNRYESAGISGQSDRFTQLTAAVAHQQPLRDDWSLLADARLDGRWHDDIDSLDNLSLDLSVGTLWQQADQSLQLKLNGQRYLLDERTYRNLYGVSIDYRRALGERLSLGGFLSGNRLEYRAGTRDSDMLLAGVSARWRPQEAAMPVLELAVYAGSESPRDDNPVTAGSADRRILGAQLSAGWLLSSQVRLNAAWIVQQSDYAGPYYLLTPLTADDRDDLYQALLGEVQWQLTPRTTAFVEYSLRDNDSNTALLDYRRHQASIGVRHQF